MSHFRPNNRVIKCSLPICNKQEIYDSGVESVYLVNEEDKRPLWFCCHTCMQMMKHLVGTYETDETNGRSVQYSHKMNSDLYNHMLHSVYQKNDDNKTKQTCQLCVNLSQNMKKH